MREESSVSSRVKTRAINGLKGKGACAKAIALVGIIIHERQAQIVVNGRAGEAQFIGASGQGARQVDDCLAA